VVGDLSESNLDWFASSYVDPWTHCAYLASGSGRVMRDGDPGSAPTTLLVSYRTSFHPTPWQATRRCCGMSGPPGSAASCAGARWIAAARAAASSQVFTNRPDFAHCDHGQVGSLRRRPLRCPLEQLTAGRTTKSCYHDLHESARARPNQFANHTH
jgi:hypothetical protein